MDNTAVHDKRKIKRSYLIYYLRVYDRKTGQLLGHLVDITQVGIMLVSDQPIAVGQTFELRMTLPKLVFGKTEMNFDAESLWSSNDINPDFFDTGFQLMAIETADKAIIETLIDEYGFKD